MRKRSGSNAPTAPRLFVIGPTSPPVHGVAVMTERLLDVLAQSDRLAGHLDTRDRRHQPTVNEADFHKAAESIRLVLKALRAIRRLSAGDVVYVPVSQGVWGMIRDGMFLVAARLARRRAIVHLHGGYFATFYATAAFPLRAFIRCAFHGVSQAWVLTESLRSQMAPFVGDERVEVVPNAIEVPVCSG